jgi:hypothetical protein
MVFFVIFQMGPAFNQFFATKSERKISRISREILAGVYAEGGWQIIILILISLPTALSGIFRWMVPANSRKFPGTSTISRFTEEGTGPKSCKSCSSCRFPTFPASSGIGGFDPFRAITTCFNRKNKLKTCQSICKELTMNNLQNKPSCFFVIKAAFRADSRSFAAIHSRSQSFAVVRTKK